MALTSRDAVTAAIAAGYTGYAQKTMTTATANPARMVSMWNMNGFMPGAAGLPPATATSCSSATAGAIAVPSIATAGNRLYLASYALHSTSHLSVSPSTISLWDRAAHMGGVIANSAAAQTVNLSIPARVGTGEGYVPLLEIHSVGGLGASTSTWTMSYTNSAGVAGRSGSLSVSSGIGYANAIYRFTLQAGDIGVSSVQTVTQSVGIGTSAGQLAVVLAKPVLTSPGGLSQTIVRRNFIHLLDIGVDPCLFFTVTTGGNVVAHPSMNYCVVEG